jgi:hypothetical protein
MPGNAINFQLPDFSNSLTATELSLDTLNKAAQRYDSAAASLLGSGWQGEGGARSFANAATQVGTGAEAAIQRLRNQHTALTDTTQTYGNSEPAAQDAVAGAIRNMLNW